MGDINQRLYLERFSPNVSGPVLEIGSKDHGDMQERGNTQDFRQIYAGREYVGVDLEEGPGVDVIADLTAGIGPLQERYFDLVICCSVLEHTPRPWQMSATITRLVRPQGWLYIAVPWVCRYHPYPDDYFRFSHRGIEALFPAFDWNDIIYSTSVMGELFEIDPKNPVLDNKLAVYTETPAGPRKHLPYLQIHMLGLKTEP